MTMAKKPEGVPAMWPRDDGSYKIVVRRRGKAHAAALMERMLRFAKKQQMLRTKKRMRKP